MEELEIDIPDELLELAKERAKAEGKTLEEWVGAILTRNLELENPLQED